MRISRWAWIIAAAAVWLCLLSPGLGWTVLQAQPGYTVREVRDGGVVRGTVRLHGTTLPTETFEVTKNVEECGPSKPSPRLRVGKQRGVKDALVSIDDITEGKAWGRSSAITLDQQKCEYVPHVLIVPLGRPLDIVNSDAVLHNVHAYVVQERPRTLFNIAQPRRGLRTSVRPVNRPGLVLATCDAGHPWMSAYIYVAPHPYVAVTGEDGSFVLNDVPAGTFRLRMWHAGVAVISRELEKGAVRRYHFEAPYEVLKEITVPAKGAVSVDFELVLR